MVEALLEAGACPTTTDSAGRCPLQLAITYWPRVRHAAPLVEEDDGRFQAYLDNQHTRSQQTFNLLLNAGAKVGYGGWKMWVGIRFVNGARFF